MDGIIGLKQKGKMVDLGCRVIQMARVCAREMGTRKVKKPARDNKVAEGAVYEQTWIGKMRKREVEEQLVIQVVCGEKRYTMVEGMCGEV